MIDTSTDEFLNADLNDLCKFNIILCSIYKNISRIRESIL